jgi:hypothetical protein
MKIGNGGHNYLAALAVTLVVVALAAGFLLGRGSGHDLAAARSSGEQQGRQVGAEAGSSVGFVIGLKREYPQSFENGFGSGYVSAYRRAFQKLGQYPPANRAIDVPPAS